MNGDAVVFFDPMGVPTGVGGRGENEQSNDNQQRDEVFHINLQTSDRKGRS